MQKSASGKILSIIIPMYNSKRFIRKCLDSMILAQADMRQLEILVVNDGSKDCSPAIAEEYVRRWPDTIRLLHKENGGHGSAINLGVANCTGKYLKIVDADDWVQAEGLKQILNLLQNINMVDALLVGYQIYDIRTDQAEVILPKQTEKCAYLKLAEVMKEWGKYKRFFTLHGLIYQTAFYRSIPKRLPEHVFYDDAYFNVVYASRISRLCVVNELFYVYRIGDVSQSVSNTNRVKRVHQMETVLFRICETAKDEQSLSKAGEIYWYQRTLSFLSDYLITAFLRFDNRKAGRRIARSFIQKIKIQNEKLYHMSRKNYCLLHIMSILHMKEEWLNKLFRVRAQMSRNSSARSASKLLRISDK